MNKINYNKEMKKIIAECREACEKRTLLLHACCAPCSSTCMEKVRDDFDTTVYFFNPNITNEAEYNKRAEELERLIGIYNSTAQGHIELIVDKYNPSYFIEIAKGYEECPERGERCLRCFEMRLRQAAKTAKDNGFDYFTTTLTLSPLKDEQALNQIGIRLATEIGGISWLPSDFKKEGGYQRSIELSREYNLYWQDYCGCVYSKNQREREKKMQGC